MASLGFFSLLVVLAVLVGGQFTGGEWYLGMNHPSWIPPPLVMAVAWAVVFALMTLAAWMIWDSVQSVASAALVLWGLQLLLSPCWFWFYFGLHRPGWALAVMAVWFAVALMVILLFRPLRPVASILMLPVAGWLLFVWVLNLVQWQLNGGGLDTIF
jgi:tryptophan-rich sensory protein